MTNSSGFEADRADGVLEELCMEFKAVGDGRYLLDECLGVIRVFEEVDEFVCFAFAELGGDGSDVGDNRVEVGRCGGAGSRCVARGGERGVEKVDGVCGAKG